MVHGEVGYWYHRGYSLRIKFSKPALISDTAVTTRLAVALGKFHHRKRYRLVENKIGL
jgi:hypothetical protein